MNVRGLAALLLGMFVLVGCGASGGEPAPPPGGGGDGGGGGASNPFTGRLIAEGSSYILDMNLTANEKWEKRLNAGTAWESIALHLPANEVHVIGTSYGDAVTVEAYDLDTFGTKSAFLWTDSEALAYGGVDALAVSPDGEHLAAIFSGQSPFLEIINRNTHEVVYEGDPGLVGADMIWLDDDLLVFAAEINDPSVDVAGGIVAVSLEEMAAAPDSFNLYGIVGFAPNEWAVAEPFDFAFSHDWTQLVYSWNGDLWVNELQGEPSHQLTTGPSGLVGPVFSPDGQYIAFVEHRTYTGRDTFVIPNHREAPFFVDSGNLVDTQAYLLQESTLVETMLVWLDE